MIEGVRANGLKRCLQHGIGGIGVAGSTSLNAAVSSASVRFKLECPATKRNVRELAQIRFTFPDLSRM